MRILIHGINFSPELTGIGKYSGEMAEWLAMQGHEVRVVTAPPYYPQWRLADGFTNWWSRVLSLSNQKQYSNKLFTSTEKTFTLGSLLVYRCPLWIPNKPSGIKRILHLASFALSSFPIMLSQIFWCPDVVLVVEPPLFCAPQAWIVARLSGAKAWLHIQDYEVDAAFELNLLKGAILRRVVMNIERWLMRRFDRVSTISQNMVNLAATKGVAHKKIVLFPNWVDIETIAPKYVQQENDAINAYRAKLGISRDAVVALYSGNMGLKQGLEILASVAKLLLDETKIVFVFCGNGAGRDALVSQCKQLSNVRFLDLQPLSLLGELLCMADIHLLPQRADAADLVMPSKINGMLASGRPIIATANVGTEISNVVSYSGLVVPPEKPKEFSTAIRMLAKDTHLRLELGRAGRLYAEKNLDSETILSRFELDLKTLVKKSVRV